MSEDTILHMNAGPALDEMVSRAIRRWHDDEERCAMCPEYSSHADLALDALLWMRLQDWWFEVSSHAGKDGGYQCWLDHASDPEGTRSICWYAPTFALAVCRCIALAATRKKEA